MELITPNFGLFFWTLILFGILFFLLRAFAWKPILAALSEREAGIEQALQAAEAARGEMERLKADNEAILREARAERDKILKEAQDLKNDLVNKAKAAADQEAARIIGDARNQIASEKNAAMAEMKTLATQLSLEIAEKLLRRQLSDKGAQEAYARELAETLKLN
jgi:F-type H+-transporting ATPase subunit b